MKFEHRTTRVLARMIAFLGLGASLVLLLSLGEYIPTLPGLEWIQRPLYRLGYIATLPARGVVLPVFPQIHHHWPLAHTIAVGMVAPFFWWGFLVTIRVLLRLINSLIAFFAKPKAGEPVASGSVSRRAFMINTAKWGAMAAGTGVIGYSSLWEPDQLRTRRYRVPIAGLPDELAGLRLLLIADTHYGPFTPLPFLEHAFAKATALNADAVLLAGDYVHRSPLAIAPGIGAFYDLRSRFGSVSVLGNHEHWEGQQACLDALKGAGVQSLDNSRCYLTAEGFRPDPLPGRSICVAGLGDLWEGKPSFHKALHGVPDDMPRLLLSHNPDCAERTPEGCRVDLMLAGHTHAGQVALPVVGAPAVPSKYGKKYLGGMCRGPQYPVLVSRGVGLSGLPLRFRVPPELVELTLQSKSSDVG